MKKCLKSILSAASMAAFVTLLTGCSDFGPTGDGSTGENVEISAAVMGALAFSSLGDTEQLNAALSMAETGMSQLGAESGTSVASVGYAKQRLCKSMERTIEPEVDMSDQDKGIVRFIYRTETLFYVALDTVTIRWDEYAQDDIPDNENIISLSGKKEYTNGKIEYYSVSDLDGDGVVMGQAAYNGAARIYGFTFYTNGVIGYAAGEMEELTMDVHAGPDGNYDADADNKVLALEWKLTLGTETLGLATFEDADGDGFVLDGERTAPSAVDVELYDAKQPFRVFVEYSRLAMRVLTDGNNGNDKILSLSGEEKLTTGRISTFSLLDQDGDSVIDDGDMVHAIFETASSPAGDPVKTARAELVFDPQSGLENAQDNLYYEFHISEEKRIGEPRSWSLDFVTVDPIAGGGAPESGHLEMEAVFSDGRSASITVDFSSAGFSGTYVDPDGNTLTIEWDSAGNVISSSEG